MSLLLVSQDARNSSAGTGNSQPHERGDLGNLGGSGSHGAAQLGDGQGVDLGAVVLVRPQVDAAEGVAGPGGGTAADRGRLGGGGGGRAGSGGRDTGGGGRDPGAGGNRAGRGTGRAAAGTGGGGGHAGGTGETLRVPLVLGDARAAAGAAAGSSPAVTTALAPR